MTSNRKTLPLRLGGDETSSLGQAEILAHAIEHELCVRALYNRGRIILVPQILYERHGDAHVDGVVLDREGVKPAEEKLGTFKLAGLRDLVVTMEPVRPMPGFDRDDARYAEKILGVIGGWSASMGRPLVFAEKLDW